MVSESHVAEVLKEGTDGVKICHPKYIIAFDVL